MEVRDSRCQLYFNKKSCLRKRIGFSLSEIFKSCHSFKETKSSSVKHSTFRQNQFKEAKSVFKKKTHASSIKPPVYVRMYYL